MKLQYPRFTAKSRRLEEIYGDSSLVAFMNYSPEKQFQTINQLEQLLAAARQKHSE